MKFSKKHLIYILFFITTTLLTGCLPKQKTQEQKQTDQEETTVPANWQKFSNAVHKFSFFYPLHWTFRPEIDREDLLTFALEFNDDSQRQKTFWNNTVGYPYYSFSARIEKNPQNLSALDWEVRQVIDIAREEAKEGYHQVVVGPHQGVMKSGPTTPAGINYSYTFCPGNGQAYNFVYWADAHVESQEKYLPEVKQIMETTVFKN